MKVIAPTYYKDFVCSAGNCKHSCCIGWEIDIDYETYSFYSELEGSFGNKMRMCIDASPQPHFILSDDERCPFLNSNNLCDIIINLGEDKLCDICNDHPRFRNYFSNRTEMGLGLSCEAAAELICGFKDVVQFVKLNNDEEKLTEKETVFFSLRQDVLSIIQDRYVTVDNRIQKIFDKYDVAIPDYSASEWAAIFLGFERLDSNWTDNLHKLQASVWKSDISIDFATIAEQLLVYFIYRHFADGMNDGRIKERLSFAIISTLLIINMHYATGNEIAEVARAYSAEIEYSEENTDKLLDILQQI